MKIEEWCMDYPSTVELNITVKSHTHRRGRSTRSRQRTGNRNLHTSLKLKNPPAENTSGAMASKLRKEFIKLLEEDREFRYTVAGYLGLAEILKRLDSIEEEIRKLWEEVKTLRENQEKLWLEVKNLREGQEKLWENSEKLWAEVKSLREGQEKLWDEVRSLREGQEKLWQGQEKLWEGQEKLWQEVKSLRIGQEKLWEGQERLWAEVRDMRVTLDRVAVTLDRLTISVEEEALSHVRHRLREMLGVEVELDRLFVDSKEIDIYGVAGDLAVVGEATVRMGRGLVDEVLEKVELLKQKKPEALRPRLVKVVYADYATPEALRYAEEKDVWVLKWSGSLTPLKVVEIS
ncbi:MAG: hypothetical protein QXM50_01155 [Candidatus Caldarchaeum sp.]